MPTCTTSRRRSPRSTKAAGMRGVLGQTIIQFPVADAKTPAEGLARAAAFIARFKGDDADRPGGVAARALHQRPGDADRGARSRDPGAGPALHPPGRDRRRGEGRERTRGGESRPATSSRSASSPARGRWPLTACGCRPTDIATLARSGRRRVAQPREQHEAGQRHGAGRRLPRRRRRPRPRHRRRRQQQRPRHVRGDAPGVVPGQAHQPATRARSGAAAALEMATLGGARALGNGRPHRLARSRQAGRPHHRADATRRGRHPMFDPISHLVYTTRGDDVDTTIVNGQILMRGREVRTLDAPACWPRLARRPSRCAPRSGSEHRRCTGGGGSARRNRGRSRPRNGRRW